MQAVKSWRMDAKRNVQRTLVTGWFLFGCHGLLYAASGPIVMGEEKGDDSPDISSLAAPAVNAPAFTRPAAAASPDSVPAASTTTSVTAPVAEAAVTAPAAPLLPAAALEGPPDKASAADALKQQKDDASAEKNLKQVFEATEKTYSLAKKGTWALNYDIDYTYYRDTRFDLSLNDNSTVINRFRLEEDAQHTIANTLNWQYGLRNNMTLTASLPFVAKADITNDRTTTGLGDVAVGFRWEPYPIERKKMPLILSANVSTKTGASPYDINPLIELATGKGYYAVGGGISTRKYIDPIVLFGSLSANYGIPEKDLNQVRGSRILTDLDPGISGGFAVGFAYSLNYDVSLTMSYQQAFAIKTKFYFSNGDNVTSADQTTAMMNIALGVRVSPKTIINGTVGFGLTEDSPDVNVGLSFPLEFSGWFKKKD